MKDKKPRKLVIDIHINADESMEGICDEAGQHLSIRVRREGTTVSARKVQSITYYDRSTKPKILNQLQFRRSSDFSVSHDDAIRKYSQLWAIDTNRKELFGQSANISAVTVCGTDGSNEHYPVLAIIFGQVSGNPELYGWRKFIEFLQQTSRYDARQRYGLVVDSELSLIPKLNDRGCAIHGQFFLPQNWDLIYATSDSGKESIFNRILAQSDQASLSILNLISGMESNAKHWLPVVDEEQHLPTFLPLVEVDG